MELNCIKITNNHPDRLNEEGKRELGIEIIEEMPIEDLNKFLEFWGHK